MKMDTRKTMIAANPLTSIAEISFGEPNLGLVPILDTECLSLVSFLHRSLANNERNGRPKT